MLWSVPHVPLAPTSTPKIGVAASMALCGRGVGGARAEHRLDRVERSEEEVGVGRVEQIQQRREHAEVTLAFLQSGGVENRSTAAPQPPDETIVQWARDVVGF